MKNLTLNLFTILIAGLTIGCSDKVQYDSFRWSRPSSAPSAFTDLNSQNYDLKINKKEIEFQQQFINGVAVEQSFSKQISDHGLQFLTSNWINDVPVSLRFKIWFMKLQSHFIKPLLQRKYVDLKLDNLFEEPSLIIQDHDVNWKIITVLPSGQLQGYFFDSRLQLVNKLILGSGGGLAEATLFPDGPLKSQLQNVVLPDLAQNRTLNSLMLRVSTQSHEQVYSENSQFNYSVEDHRFEQVQVFYYMNKTLHWIESELQYQSPYQLEAETYVGFPEKTNTAFYYQRKIRLGEGDGSTFSKIPLDPSLVIHETFHSIIDTITRLPFQGEGGSINEGLADFFTAMLLQNPNLGEVSYKLGPYKRTIRNNLKLQDKTGGLYHDSGLISGLLWELSNRLGQETGLKISWETLLRLTPLTKITDFNFELNEVILQLPPEKQLIAREVLAERGWGL